MDLQRKHSEDAPVLGTGTHADTHSREDARPPDGPTMRAFAQDAYGPPSVLRLRDVPVPRPARGEVLVRVLATSVNPADLFLMTGKPRLMRLGTGLVRPKRAVGGRDVAGVVVALGPEATRFEVGARVFGELGGGHGAYCVAPEELLARIPDNVSYESAAAVPVAGVTALKGLRDKGRVQAGQRVLIHGATGGVGTFAVQLAKLLGAHVIATYRGDDAAWLRSLGADEVCDVRRQAPTALGMPTDVVFDVIGDLPLRAWLGALTPRGIYVSGAAPLGRIFHVALTSLVTRRVTQLSSQANAADLATLAGYLEAGSLVPAIRRTLPFDELPAALTQQQRGHARGKTVVRMSDAS